MLAGSTEVGLGSQAGHMPDRVTKSDHGQFYPRFDSADIGGSTKYSAIYSNPSKTLDLRDSVKTQGRPSKTQGPYDETED